MSATSLSQHKFFDQFLALASFEVRIIYVICFKSNVSYIVWWGRPVIYFLLWAGAIAKMQVMPVES